MQYLKIFSKKTDDYVRYWASVSTPKTDKDGNKTDKYMRANISLRLSDEAVKTFKDHAEKTKTKGIKQLNVKVMEAWLKAHEPKEGDPFVYLFVNKIVPAESEEDDEEEED